MNTQYKEVIKYQAYPSLDYGEYIRQIYPDYFNALEDVKTITFQVTENCCLNCTYCYQVHGTDSEMTFEDVAPWLEKILNDEFEAISTKNTKAIIWEFIGGEPLMKIDLIIQISDYIFETMIKKHHPWLFFSKISISSNGLLYFNEKVQYFLEKYANLVSLGISLDGNKELHDKCRLDLQGNGSYDRVISAIRHYKKHYGIMPNIKMTFAPENLPYLAESYKYLLTEGYTELFGNCVYEDVWTEKDGTILYYQLKEFADYLIDNNLYNEIYVSFFDEQSFSPMNPDENENWCGGVGSCMFSIDNKGNLYHCIRYMKSALQGQQAPLVIGDTINGVGVLPNHKQNLELSCNITRRSQSTDECFYCPVARGCGWCSGYNYQMTGSVNKRVTFICPMHKARGLANVYYWNKLYRKLNIDKTFVNYLSDEESLKFIPEEELKLLQTLERG